MKRSLLTMYFENNSMASIVLSVMRYNIKEKGFVSVADYYLICNKEPHTLDFNYGWKFLHASNVERDDDNGLFYINFRDPLYNLSEDKICALDTQEDIQSTTRSDILDEAKKCVCGQREEDYGSPEDNFKVIAEFWSTYKGVEFTPTDVAMMMGLLKVARIKSGTGTKDSFVDLAGYAACGGEIALKEEREDI